MAVDTHCLPNGSLGTAELPVCGINTGTVTVSDPGSGNRRGIIVFIHGLQASVVSKFPQPVSNNGTALFYNRFGDFESTVVADGWVFVYPSVQEDFYSGQNSIVGIYNDVAADSGHGSRYLASTLHWWDHIVTWITATYGSNHPTVVTGFSFGAFKTLQIAANRTVSGYAAHCPATLLGNCGVAYTPPETFSNITWTGLNLSTTAMNAVTVPGIIGYGTNDTAVGYNLAGTGGTPVSNTDSIITNAVNAGQPVTRNATSETHEFTGTPSAVTGLASSGTLTQSGSILTMQASTSAFPSTGALALVHSGTTHFVNYTGTSGSTFSGATIPTGSLTVSSGDAVSGGTDAITYAAWVASTLNPYYPVSF